MPRTGRIVVPDFPHHIVQRGHNRSPVFVEPRDFSFYLGTLAALKKEIGCKVHAYCLMTNHVHLIVNPGDDPTSLARLMKRVAGRYTRYVNRAERRTGTVWDGRFKSSPIEADLYLLACSRYVDLNPVRAKIVASPQRYRWSSYNAKIGRTPPGWLDEDPFYRALGSTRAERCRRYREWVRASIPPMEWEMIRTAVRRGHPCGSERFRQVIEERIGRRVECRGPGRPRRSGTGQENRSVPKSENVQ